MDLRPSWRGLHGMTAVILVTLPAQITATSAVAHARTAVAVQAVAYTPRREHLSAAMRLSQATALSRVRRAGIHVHSTGRCADRSRPTCTSLDSIRYGTLTQTIGLRRASHCGVVITGGTETGHAHGAFSHGNGYKVDVAHNRCVDAYIIRTFRRGPIRDDGAPLYLSNGGDVYASEPNHWDILFR